MKKNTFSKFIYTTSTSKIKAMFDIPMVQQIHISYIKVTSDMKIAKVYDKRYELLGTVYRKQY